MDIFQNKILAHKATIHELEKQSSNLSTLRLVAFVLSAIIITVLANQRLVGLVLVLTPLCLAGFAYLVRRHNDVDDEKRYTTFLKEINEHEILRLENKLSTFAPGDTFVMRDHPYVSDLDIFGQHSVFQLLNRTTTEPGNELLAAWLSAPASNEIILKRQSAIKELSPKLTWRQHLQASGMNFRHTKDDYTKLRSWIETPVKLLPNRARHLVVSIVLSIVSTSAAVYFFSHILSFKEVEQVVPYLIPLSISLVVNAFVLRQVKAVVEETTANVHQHIKIVAGFQSLIKAIESDKFQSETLQKLQFSFNHENYSAEKELQSLKKTLEVLQVKGRKREFNNLFYAMFNGLWFLDIYLIMSTEKWKVRNGQYLKGWADAISEFEALSSVAGFHYSNPTSVFPDIIEEPYSIYFDNLGHPLLGMQRRVSNNIDLKGRGEIAMITGSNMAGKSTFLRTIGMNVVLALMGAPCCATTARVSNMKVFSSMRTQDNLEEGISSFYAELRRVEQLLKRIAEGQPIFFLIDEMFKGTNSKDRHRGGFSLIKQLKELNAFGIISTHDLDLADASGSHAIVKNYSFNSYIREGELIFDYKLTDGLCKDFNASELMRRSGIRILPEE